MSVAVCVAGEGAAVLAHLRSATRQDHLALEGVLGLLDEHLELGAYTEMLRRFYGFWAGWEPQIAALLDDPMLLQPRRRLHLLAADLMTLGLSRHDLARLPDCPLVGLTGVTEALGSLYVMEGSTLGGKVISRNLERCLGAQAGTACSYFHGYGLRTGQMWRAFLAELDRVPAGQAEMAACGARATFQRLGWWLTRKEGSASF